VPLRDCLKHAFMNPTLPTLLWQPAAGASYWQGSRITSKARTLLARLAQRLRTTAAGAAGAGVRRWTLDAGRCWILGASLCVSDDPAVCVLATRHYDTMSLHIEAPTFNDCAKLQPSALCARGLVFASNGRISFGSRCTRDAGLGGSVLSRTLWRLHGSRLLLTRRPPSMCLQRTSCTDTQGRGGLGHVALGSRWTLDAGVSSPTCLPTNGPTEVLPLQAEAPPVTD
jgi:hypothetical protein